MDLPKQQEAQQSILMTSIAMLCHNNDEQMEGNSVLISDNVFLITSGSDTTRA